jgi:hypothetical protein
MVRALAIAMLCGGCTLIVDHQLSANPGGCSSDLPFTDGTPGNATRFHSGVSVLSFRGAAFPPAGGNPANYGATLAFLYNTGLELAGGVTGDTVFIRNETNFTPTWASTTPGHEGPLSFGCAEVVAATSDTLHSRTSLQLIAADCGNDLFYDGGTYTGAPESLSPAIAWANTPDGGSMIATVVGGRGQACPETFPPTCFPPTSVPTLTAGGLRRVDALIDAQGHPIWIVSNEGGDTRIYSANFAGETSVVPWGGAIAALASDVGIAMRIQSGELQAQIFDATGRKNGNEFHSTLGDATVHGLEIARFGTLPILRIAWIGGDTRARVANFDATVAAAPVLGTPSVVCGSNGASFVAPMSTTTAAVLKGDALYLRHVD